MSDQEAIGILQNDLTIDVNSILIEENEIYVLLDEEIPCRNCEEK